VPAPGDTPPTIEPQEPGTRPARALPYDLHVESGTSVIEQTVTLTFVNDGTQGANFYVYALNRLDGPRRYTVEAGKRLDDSWSVAETDHDYALAVYGPNGFYRRLMGTVGKDVVGLDLMTGIDRSTGVLQLTLTNQRFQPLTCRVTDRAYGAKPRLHLLGPCATVEDRLDLASSGHWYDLAITIEGAPAWSRVLAGHLETGRISISDPASTAPVLMIV